MKSRLEAKWGRIDPHLLNRKQRQEYRADASLDMRERGVKRYRASLPHAFNVPLVNVARAEARGGTRKQLRDARHAVTRLDHRRAASHANKLARNKRAKDRKATRKVAA